MAERSGGAYVHTPFCSAVCPYCDFAVVAGADHLIERYCAAVVSEVEADRPWRSVDSVYFGGGTPSRVSADLLGSILQAIRDIHGVSGKAEVTLEANPEDWSNTKARSYREAGFNRVSFGGQSFDPGVLVSLGRRHGPGDIGSAVAAARDEGFDVSIDLIYGTPGETQSSWVETVEAAIQTSPDHISCYALTVEPGTELGRQVRAGSPAPDPDTQADRFQVADSLISAAGLSRYEVSNWAKPGKECRYNSLVWAQGEYLAYGNGAHRFRDSVRSRNIRRVDAYIKAVEEGRSAVSGGERLDGWDLEVDRLFVGLRRVQGIEPGPGVDAFMADPDGARLAAAGVVVNEDGWLRVANPMLTDEVLRIVIGLEGGEHGGDPDTLMPANA